MASLSYLYAQPPRQAGFSYIAVLFLVLLMSLGLALASQPIATAIQREREAELLFVGQQYRLAIASYYRSAPDGIAVLPSTLEELVLDKRFVAPKRHLRKLYADPMTDSMQWGLVRNPQNQLTGVYSLAAGEPLGMQQGRALGIVNDAAGSYADWKFLYVPNEAAALPAQQAPD